MRQKTFTVEFFAKHGRAGGKKAAKRLTKKQRIDRATKAVAAREAKRKAGRKRKAATKRKGRVSH